MDLLILFDFCLKVGPFFGILIFVNFLEASLGSCKHLHILICTCHFLKLILFASHFKLVPILLHFGLHFLDLLGQGVLDVAGAGLELLPNLTHLFILEVVVRNGYRQAPAHELDRALPHRRSLPFLVKGPPQPAPILIPQVRQLDQLQEPRVLLRAEANRSDGAITFIRIC